MNATPLPSLLLVAALMTAGCPGEAGQEREADSENAIRELVFSYVLASDSAQYGSVHGYCLGLETRQGYADPSASVMASLGQHKPPVWPISSCRSALADTALERHDTVSVFVRPVDFDGTSAARVEARYWRGSLSAHEYECSFRKETRTWILRECPITKIS